MRIIDTENNAKRKTQNAKLRLNRQNEHPGSTIYNLLPTAKRLSLALVFLALALIFGCAPESDLKRAQGDARESQDYYQRAVTEYKELIAQGKDLDRLYLELGKLYYDHSMLQEAIAAFKKSHEQQAKKYLAVAYYRLADFTDALDVFNKYQISDEEYLYYYGLTCEKLNLFDQALGVYAKIKGDEFLRKAQERIDSIQKGGSPVNIKELDERINNILANAPSAKLYQQASALILSCDENVEITPEGQQISYLHYLIKILNERGKENFSETHIDYDSTYEKVELIYARTIKPDGTIAEVGSRHIRDVSKYLNFPLYSNARVYIISFPEVVEGATIEYKVKILRNQLINKKDFVLNYPVQTQEPIIEARFSISSPKGKPLHIKILNDKYNDFGSSLNPKVEEKDDRLIYSWQFKDIPQIIPESNMPPDVQVNPTFLVSTFDNWQDIYDWWWPLAKDKIAANSQIREKVKELTAAKASDEERIRAIYSFCAQKIRYVAVEYGQAGFEPHKAEDIFRNKYGDCKDQAILLVTMLKDAGFSAWPVLISTKDYYNLNEDFPSMLFNHCIAAVSLKDKVIFLDPTAETCAFGDLPAGDQARRVLSIKEDGYKIQETPLYPAAHNSVKQDFKIKVNSDETIEAGKSIFTYGVFDQGQRYWLLYTQPDLIKEALTEEIQNVSIGSRLEGYNIKNLEDLNNTLVLEYTFRGSEYFTAAGSLRILPQLAVLDTSLVAKDRRKYGIDFGILQSKENYFEIDFPADFVIRYVPGNVARDSRWLKFNVEYRRNNNKIYFIQKAEYKESLIPESEYPDFKKFFEELAKATKQRIVLEKVK